MSRCIILFHFVSLEGVHAIGVPAQLRIVRNPCYWAQWSKKRQEPCIIVFIFVTAYANHLYFFGINCLISKIGIIIL